MRMLAEDELRDAVLLVFANKQGCSPPTSKRHQFQCRLATDNCRDFTPNTPMEDSILLPLKRSHRLNIREEQQADSINRGDRGLSSLSHPSTLCLGWSLPLLSHQLWAHPSCIVFGQGREKCP
ncbi:hypothetical protein JD844_011014 [Phrynosoma platyrhinos]|uniref:Uncharacterized protein n=1 Tax=Phrynosoma platyrhinos TaxID=52577 RepID=A0ABQ7THC1_PHRPL|nr:hypothetical protein JD844_011014 [Phrynosoma platyrhinos]